MTLMWHAAEPEDGILRVGIDRAERPVNSLSRATLEELSQLLARIRGMSLRGVVFQSAKPGNFIAGADVTEFRELRTDDDARAFSRLGQKVFQELASLSIPTVALISGACLGGGLEFALACRYRIADDSRKTQLGLPEVKLGIIPGWGGTTRLFDTVGFLEALPMILTGKMLNGLQAARKGLVHDAVPREAFDDAARQIVRTQGEKLRPRKRPLVSRLVDRFGFLQKLVLWQASKQVLKETHGHYPAPLAILDVVRDGIGLNAEERLALVAEANVKLGRHPVTMECVRLFFLSEAAKKPPASIGATSDGEAITKGAVIGAGAMGAGVALLMAQRGIWTRLKDIKPEFVARGLQSIRKLVKADVARRRVTPLDATRTFDHISPTTDYRGLKHADIVLEAIVEEIEIKRKVFADLAAATEPDCVLATNTSSLTVADIARDVPHPERVVGLHFFNPPHKMPLVEVVRGPRSSPQAVATAAALASRLGKTLVLVGDCPGFLVNRILAPYMNEAGYLVAEAADPMEIDRAAVEFGMPMGPLELIDLVGIDVSAHVSGNMRAAYGERMEPAPLWKRLRESTAANGGPPRVIVKSWFGKRLNPSVRQAIAEVAPSLRSQEPMSHEAIVQRLVYPIINEATRCLDEKIAGSAADVDLAMVFGTGFAPFRGGPLRYADTVGTKKIVEVLDRLAVEHPRLAPCEALRRMAAGGERYHPSDS